MSALMVAAPVMSEWMVVMPVMSALMIYKDGDECVYG